MFKWQNRIINFGGYHTSYALGPLALGVNVLKYDRPIQNSGNIFYLGYVSFSALLGKLSKLQQ